MCQNCGTDLQNGQRQIIRRSSMSSSSPPILILLKFCNLEQRPQTKNYSQQKNHYRHQPNLHHCQKYKERHFFPRCGFIFLILLSVIKESLTTTYSSLPGVTTMASQTNFVPYFDFDVPRNITVTVGQTGFLHCRVERLGDKDVSWIRKRDLHILTAGATTYTSDQRFQVLHPEGSGNWTLQIKYPQLRDSGIYECQINTEPKMSLSYTFNVVELKATIIGPADLYVKSGSDINLTCKIMQGPHELGNIFWYKGPEIIDMATNENEIDSGTRITVENDWLDGLSSRLKIRGASSSDTGNYTCVPTIAKSSSVYVHVIIGEHPAAMQHNSSITYCGNFYISLCCVIFIVLTHCLQHWMCSKACKGSCVQTTAISLPSKEAPRGTSSPTTTFEFFTLSASTTTSTSMSKAKPMIDPSLTLTKISSSKKCILSAAPHTRASAFSSLTHLHTSATTTNTDCENTRLYVSHGRIIR